MAIYVFTTSTGELYSYCPDDSDPVASQEILGSSGLGVKTGLAPLDATHIWDAASQNVLEVQAAVAANVVSVYSLVSSFSPDDFATLRASQDPTVQQLLFVLQTTSDGQVNLADPFIAGLVPAIAALNLASAPEALRGLTDSPAQPAQAKT